jgi:hypothetical protein
MDRILRSRLLGREVTVSTAIIAVAGSLLGVVLGFIAQYLQAGKARRWQLEDLKREAYAELLRSISASFAQAYYGEGKSEDSNILKATAMIQLLAEKNISESARDLQVHVDRTHRLLRSDGPDAAQDEIDETDQERIALIVKFKEDLHIRPPRKSA